MSPGFYLGFRFWGEVVRFKVEARQLQGVGMGGGCAPSRKLKYIWTKITLNVPKLQQLCINILLHYPSFPPPPPQ